MATSAARLRGVQNIAAAPGFMGIIQQCSADVKTMKAKTIRGEEDVKGEPLTKLIKEGKGNKV